MDEPEIATTLVGLENYVQVDTMNAVVCNPFYNLIPFRTSG